MHNETVKTTEFDRLINMMDSINPDLTFKELDLSLQLYGITTGPIFKDIWGKKK